MEIRHLKYFLATSMEESITNAAHSLHITQPTLSKQLMELEDELGRKLFIRGNRRLTLTEDGLLFKKRAREIVDLIDKTKSELAVDNSQIGGEISIGSGETDAMRIIARIVKKLKSEHPALRFNLYSGNSDDVTDRLDKGLLDFGILIEPSDIQRYDYIKLPINDIWGVLMRCDSPLASLKAITPADLIDKPVIISRQTLVRNELSGWFGVDIEKMNIAATYNLVFNASLMVDEGVGYALCLDKLVKMTGDSCLVFRPLVPALKTELIIVWKKYQVFSKATQIFLDTLQEELNHINKE